MVLLRTAPFPIGLCLLALLFTGIARAAPDFPQLTGRVVDNANLLSPSIEQQLAGQLKQHEQDTGNQVVVVTITSLQGYAIDDYGYQLGRHWGIGQADRNNGALLIVAADDREVRIEVGYGLEGTLTDARSHDIIQQVILPQFRNNRYEDGIVRGTEAILGTLQGTYEPPEKTTPDISGLFYSLVIILISAGEFVAARFGSRMISAGVLGAITVLVGWQVLGSLKIGLLLGFFVVIFHFFIGGGGGPTGSHGKRYYRRGSSSGFGSGGFSSGGGSFGGGGGSFGGGGASGRW
ncbi:MAG TPA: TPM domain-containing protein [Gammaproteobacteria bacterium]|nr:TPM domain-containing protein [Gammaproteobacteria bacterium]